jgi:hypothetical protein
MKLVTISSKERGKTKTRRYIFERDPSFAKLDKLVIALRGSKINAKFNTVDFKEHFEATHDTRLIISCVDKQPEDTFCDNCGCKKVHHFSGKYDWWGCTTGVYGKKCAVQEIIEKLMINAGHGPRPKMPDDTWYENSLRYRDFAIKIFKSLPKQEPMTIKGYRIRIEDGRWVCGRLYIKGMDHATVFPTRELADMFMTANSKLVPVIE